MSRNDGKPKSVVTESLDPLPFADYKGVRYSVDAMKFAAEFAPRPGFVSQREAYEQEFPNADWELFDAERENRNANTEN